jgi:hypothetical protein
MGNPEKWKELARDLLVFALLVLPHLFFNWP